MASQLRRLRTSVAPMIDVTDSYYLRLLRLISPFGNHQLWTEMIHANTFSHGHMHLNKRKLVQHIPIRELQDFSHGVVVQIGASQPEDAYIAVRELAKLGIRHINLNCGCPSRDVQMGSFGVVLMKTPETTAQIVQAMSLAAKEASGPPDSSSGAASRSIKISVKCRIGVDEDESPEFLYRFIDTITDKSSPSDPVDIILHARRAWLQGLSPEENRIVPQLNHTRVYEMTKAFPHLSFSINGGIDSVDAVAKHLESSKIDSVMMGRKIREDPWFLSLLDQHIYGVAEGLVPSHMDVLARYMEFADEMHKEYATRYSVLGRPLGAFFHGRKGRSMRAHLNHMFAQARIKSPGSSAKRGCVHRYSATFSELLQEAMGRAEAEHNERVATAIARAEASGKPDGSSAECKTVAVNA
ncbi:hypothetical protein GGI25_000408 [Coemansia spiralis]|uniref:DUS-like FMN-binding domain-containing protein n=2 Tax=Coemansia TaxID=4863 RepID=A0A9W8L143_9FUNG|nr:hypothetical protein BX070DRAFT_221442 [Coemansia spiralis]KAJ1996345.1 hypothetical protein EDC05_000235 [Coemansia umbellata]KAJ2624191.1 hypothetical protein GGI26_001767 [Coemansia sp. RSA 1358]KAJ2680773.1 hypothetical protein GGI25_000408 [Coemansia spiralis]